MVFTKTPSPSYEIRWAFYSKEWFESVAPKAGGCTGTILGDWETNRGRTTIVRLGRPEKGEVSLEQLIEGTYSLNNGTFTGTRGSSGTIRGEWKDDTGTGKMVIMSTRPGEFTGQWTRTTGSSAASGWKRI